MVSTAYPSAIAFMSRAPDYFVSLGLPEERASELHQQYYRQYGLAVRKISFLNPMYDNINIADVTLATWLSAPSSSRPPGFRQEMRWILATRTND